MKMLYLLFAFFIDIDIIKLTFLDYINGNQRTRFLVKTNLYMK